MTDDNIFAFWVFANITKELFSYNVLIAKKLQGCIPQGPIYKIAALAYGMDTEKFPAHAVFT